MIAMIPARSCPQYGIQNAIVPETTHGSLYQSPVRPLDSNDLLARDALQYTQRCCASKMEYSNLWDQSNIRELWSSTNLPRPAVASPSPPKTADSVDGSMQSPPTEGADRFAQRSFATEYPRTHTYGHSSRRVANPETDYTVDSSGSFSSMTTTAQSVLSAFSSRTSQWLGKQPIDNRNDIGPSRSGMQWPHDANQDISRFALSTSGNMPDVQHIDPDHTRRKRPENKDEFDGQVQFLERPPSAGVETRDDELPSLPTHLQAYEQDIILGQVNDRLSQCAFDFFAKYQFPIPVVPDKRPVRVAADREWSEWVHLLKRMATKRRIPARVLYQRQIKQLITILENSLEMRHAAKHQSRPLKDDRNILQLISSGIQVARILKDAPAMRSLDELYVSTERSINLRAAESSFPFAHRVPGPFIG